MCLALFPLKIAQRFRACCPKKGTQTCSSVRRAEFYSAESNTQTECPMAAQARLCLALKARSHLSLGHRPRIDRMMEQALKARFNAPVRSKSDADGRRNESRFQRYLSGIT